MVLGSTGNGRTTLVKEMVSNATFGEPRGVPWISKLQLSRQRIAEIDSFFNPKVEFLSPQGEEDLGKTFEDLENIYRE